MISVIETLHFHLTPLGKILHRPKENFLERGWGMENCQLTVVKSSEIIIWLISPSGSPMQEMPF
jgi:hypothetical protein